ncbi:DUF5067 domain-containing protein [Arthrobacter wenxiniae]|nr:DUF5067 domain-containing protein [Arthrobacter wenxiniae]
MKKSFALIAGASVIIALSGCAGTTTAATPANSSNSSTMSAPAASMAPAQASVVFKDGVLITPEMKIEITDHKIIPVGAPGNEYGKKPVIAFWYKISNLTDKKISPMDFLFVFTAFQDNNPNAENKLNVGALPDEKFLDSQTENIKKGGTVENAVAYELTDATTPVDLVASNDMGMTQIGKMTYKLK